MNRRFFLAALGCAGALNLLGCTANLAKRQSAHKKPGKLPHKLLIAHRGASAHAPENTLPSYRLAIEQGADYVEQDLHITRDNVLVCCHDMSLERISNVEQVFPGRFKEQTIKGETVRRWNIYDFTLEEIKQLDAGSWLAPQFKGTTIPTWQEAIDAIRGKAGLCPQTTGPEIYGKLGHNMEHLVAEVLKRNGLNQPNPATPILIQSFSKVSLERLAQQHHVRQPMLKLSSVGTRWTPELLEAAKTCAQAIGPFKEDTTAKLVDMAHTAGLQVIPWTFNSQLKGNFKRIHDEMLYYLHTLNADGLFTDNPDQFPR